MNRMAHMTQFPDQTPDRTALAPALAARGVGKSFGPVRVLSSIDISVEEGEFVSLLGPSGCGKTTILRMVSGFIEPTEGVIRIGGKDVRGTRPNQRPTALIFQNLALFPLMPIWENIAFGLEVRGVDKATRRKKAEELLKLVDLPGAADKMVSQLSGGQKQRVAIARALAVEPQVMLLDEPLSALDALERVRLRQEIRALQNKLGVTTIMVTHDQEEALTMADRIVVMNHGVIEQVGSPDDIYRRPASPFVADFVGSMNFLSGVVERPGRVRLGGCDLECDGDHAAGAAVTICLRPEDVQVRAAFGANTFDAVIESLEFLGPFHRARLVADGLGEARVTADLSANLVRDLDLRTGRRLPVTLPRDRLRVFEAVAR